MARNRHELVRLNAKVEQRANSILIQAGERFGENRCFADTFNATDLMAWIRGTNFPVYKASRPLGRGGNQARGVVGKQIHDRQGMVRGDFVMHGSRRTYTTREIARPRAKAAHWERVADTAIKHSIPFAVTRNAPSGRLRNVIG